MLKHYIIESYRLLIRNKVSTLISIFGLAIGFAGVIMAGLYAKYEFSFDRFHTDHERIYRLINCSDDKSTKSPIFPATYLPEIKDRLKGVESAVRVDNYGDAVFSIDNESLIIDNLLWTDPPFFEIFSFNIKAGNKNDLNDKFKVFVSESFAEKFFAADDPTGENMVYDNEWDFEIVGIFRDFPSNSIFNADLIASFESLRDINSYLFKNWYAKGTNVFFKLDEMTDTDEFVIDLSREHIAIKPEYEGRGNFELEAVSDIHLHTYHHQWDNDAAKSDIKVVIGVVAFAIFILIISVINYSIINATRFSEKIEHMIIKKTIGASNWQMLGFAAVEIFLIVFLSLICSYYLIGLLYPVLADLEGIGVFVRDIFAIDILLGVALLVTLVFEIVFIYPAIEIRKLSATRLVSSNHSRWKRLMVNSSISLQFAFTIIIMFSSIIIYRQIDFVTSKKLGFDKEQMLMISNPWDKGMEERYARFREKAGVLADVEAITATRNSPMKGINNGGAFYMMSQKDKYINAGRVRVEKNFFRVLGAQFLHGEDFAENFDVNKDKIIINRAALEEIGDNDVIGKELTYSNIRKEPFVIAGVIENIQHEKTLQKTRPCVYFQSSEDLRGLPDIMLKMNASNHERTIAELSSIWKSISPEWPFRYQFLDDRIDKVYKNEKTALSFLAILAGISITISCIGILGLSWLTIKRRTKEVGIRKVNGAGVRDMLVLLNKDYIKWIAFGFMLSVPFSWMAMDAWLQNFAYRITVDWWIFGIAGAVTLSVALLTVSYHTIKASTANPVDALRYE